MFVLIALFCLLAGIGNLFSSTIAFTIRFGMRRFMPMYMLPPARPRFDYFIKGVIYIIIAIAPILFVIL